MDLSGGFLEQKIIMEIYIFLRLENCNLTAAHIEALNNFLTNNFLMEELDVCSNPNKEQNHHLLLHNTKISILSLKFCDINYEGMEKISEELCNEVTYLKHLNLASNSLYDEGVEYVAKFLRVNRTLISLNLSDNKIRNKGCFFLMEPLRIFKMHEDEITIRRTILFNSIKYNVSFF